MEFGVGTPRLSYTTSRKIPGDRSLALLVWEWVKGQRKGERREEKSNNICYLTGERVRVGRYSYVI